MHILADENVARPIVAWLRDSGHEVLYAAESRIQASDVELLAEAETHGFVVLTEDRDFGELVFRNRLNSSGVVLLRLGDQPAYARLARLQRAWPLIETRLPGHFIVVTRARIRLRPLEGP